MMPRLEVQLFLTFIESIMLTLQHWITHPHIFHQLGDKIHKDYHWKLGISQLGSLMAGLGLDPPCKTSEKFTNPCMYNLHFNPYIPLSCPKSIVRKDLRKFDGLITSLQWCTLHWSIYWQATHILGIALGYRQHNYLGQ